MPFRYRLQKVLDFRINQKEEQRMRVQKAQKAVYQAEQDIQKNEQETYDKFLQHLWEKAEQLEAKRQELQKLLDIEIAKLVKCEQAVKVLEKHKEKNKEAYIAEEKAAELKQFSELGVTRFFKQTQERREEEAKQLKKIEGN
jgi:flagellar biosynthesis chaperone FliJ